MSKHWIVQDQRNPAMARSARQLRGDLWWQRLPQPKSAVAAYPVQRASLETLPTVMAVSGIVLFKLFMLGLLIHSL